MNDIKNLVLAFFTRANSKKFVVWTVATAALFSHYITADQWLVITSLYLSAETTLDWKRSLTPVSQPILTEATHDVGSPTSS